MRDNILIPSLINLKIKGTLVEDKKGRKAFVCFLLHEFLNVLKVTFRLLRLFAVSGHSFH